MNIVCIQHPDNLIKLYMLSWVLRDLRYFNIRSDKMAAKQRFLLTIWSSFLRSSKCHCVLQIHVIESWQELKFLFIEKLQSNQGCIIYYIYTLDQTNAIIFCI